VHKIVKIDSLLDQSKCTQNRSIVVRYQHRFAGHLDEVMHRKRLAMRSTPRPAEIIQRAMK